jgi:hypothetical protein
MVSWILLITLGTAAYMLFRNSCVFSYRMKVLDQCKRENSLASYDKLPSYNYMMYKFWVWPMSSFEKQPEQQQRIKLVK